MNASNPQLQTDHLELTHSKFYLLAAVLLAASAVAALLSGALALSLISSTMVALMTLAKLKGHQYIARYEQWLQGSALAFSLCVLIALSSEQHQLKVWLFSIPLLIFFFFEFKIALGLILLISLLASAVLSHSGDTIANLQLQGAYIMYLGISCALVYLLEVRRRQLKPLRRTDNLTQAATREHLEDDLTKEIQRSEREGSELAVMALGIDSACFEKLSDKQRSTLIIELGRLLHNNLRLFDSYYLWDDDEFLIVLPHTSSVQANKIANELRLKVRKDSDAKQESVTISVGIAGLNVGDDAKALPKKASAALQLSQQKGDNRTELYRDQSTEAALSGKQNSGSDEEQA